MRGCGAERCLWQMQRGGAPAAVEKIEQASSAMIFSGTARRTEWAQYLPRLLAYAELLEYLVDGFGGGAAPGEGKKGIG